MKIAINIISYLPIILWFLFSVIYLYDYKKVIKQVTYRPLFNKKWYHTHLLDSIPSLFTTLGIFGTFVGIAYGLWKFDVKNIDGSIPQLLDGLKTAFFTSIFGIFFSVGFSKWVEFIHKFLDDKEEEIAQNEINREEKFRKDLISAITESLNQNFGNAIKAFIEKMNESNEDIKNNLIDVFSDFFADNLDNLKQSIDTLNLWQQENKHQIQLLITQFENTVNHFEKASESIENIAENTDRLTNSDSLLQKLILELQSVMIENTLFKDSVKELHISSDTLSQTVQGIKEVAELLNSWAEREKAFVATTDNLMSKLETNVEENANKISDFNTENQKQVSLLIETFKNISNDIANTSTSISEIASSTTTLTNNSSLLQKMILELENVTTKNSQFSQSVETLKNIANVITDSTNNVQKNSTLITSLISKEDRLISSNTELLSKYSATFNLIDDLIAKLKSVPPYLQNAAEHTSNIAKSVEILSDSRSTLKKLVGEEVENRREIITEYGQIINRTAGQLQGWYAQEQEFAKFMRELVRDLQKNEWLKRETEFTNVLNRLIRQIETTETYREQTVKSWADVKEQVKDFAKNFERANKDLISQTNEQNTFLLENSKKLNIVLSELTKQPEKKYQQKQYPQNQSNNKNAKTEDNNKPKFNPKKDKEE
jgi:hypothetical protein